MKKKKRFLSLALALVLCLGLLPTAAGAAGAAQFTAVKTGVQANGVINYGGFASLTSGEEDDGPDPTLLSALMDAQGNLICPWRTDDSDESTYQYQCSEGLICWVGTDYAHFYKDNGYYRPDGTLAFALPDEREKFGNLEPYYWLSAFHDGVALVRVCYGAEEPEKVDRYADSSALFNCQAFMIDKTGKVLARLPEEYTKAWTSAVGDCPRIFSTRLHGASEGYIWKSTGYEGYNDAVEFAWVSQSFGYTDYTGKTVLEFKGTYNGLGDFSEGLAVAGRDDIRGYIDTTGKEVIPLQYEGAWNFHEGLAAVQKDGKIGVIDKTGKVVIPFQFDGDKFYGFSDGIAVTQKDGKYGVIDTQGNTVIPFMYDDTFGYSEGYIAVGQNGKYGMVDKGNNVVVPLEYDDISEFIGGVAYAIKDGYVYVLRPSNTAYTSTQEVLVDGKAVTFSCYALKDAAGNMTNYIKLRDLADILNGTLAQFAVGWDGSVTITTKTAYTPNGSEGNTPFSGNRSYQEATAATKVNGQSKDLAAFVLNDDQGGGYTYYKLRDLAQALGFNVGWSADKGIYLETDKPYDPNN